MSWSGHTAYEFLHPEDVDDVRGAHSSLLNGGERVDVRYRHRRKSGNYVECEASARAIRDAGGGLVELIVVKRDISDTIAGDMLRRQWEFCFKRTSRGITVVDSETGTIISLNPALAEMHGGTVGDFVGKPLTTLFSADWAERIPDASETLGQNTFISYDSAHVRLDGSTFPVHTEVVATRDDQSDVQDRIAWYDDLTERQAAEHRAGLAERDFEAAFNAAPHGVAIVGLDGTFLHINQRLSETLGFSAAEMADITFQEITHPDDFDADLAQVDALLGGEPIPMRWRSATSPRGPPDLGAARRGDRARRDGSPRHFISQVQDISERKRLEVHTYELANRDSITSLFNRRRFEEELKREIARCRE